MQQPDFEFIETPIRPLPSALQLAQDAAAQTRAYHQSQQTRQQQLSDASPPNLTYAGQSQGQPLLRTPEGSVFRAGSRDSNGALRPGVVDIVSSSGVLRVGGMPRVRPIEQPTGSIVQRVAVLFAKTLATTIEFWLGGDRPVPIKVAEIPRFGRIFPLGNNLNTSLSYTTTLQGLQSTDAESPGITTGVNVYQPYLRKEIESIASVSGSASLLDPTYAGVVGGYVLLPISGAGGASINNGWSDGPFEYSDSDSFNEDAPDPAELYTAPNYELQIEADQPFYRIGAELGSTIASGEGLPGDAIAETSATFIASISGYLQEINQYRAYLSITRDYSFVAIAYDLREGGYESLILKQVYNGVVSDLWEPNPNDWRNTLATTAVTPSTDSNTCVVTNLNQRFINLSSDKRTSFTVVFPEGSTYNTLRTASVMATINRGRLQAATECTSQTGGSFEVGISSLQIEPGDKITFINFCAIEEIR